jgi:hypothetical protein
MRTMEKNNFINEIIEDSIQTTNTDSGSDSINLSKIVIVYGTLLLVGAYNLINAISSIFLSLPFDFGMKPGDQTMIKWTIFDITEILLHIAVVALCFIAYKAVQRNADNLELLVIAPLAFEFFGFTVKSVMYRKFFSTIYKMPWQNCLFILATLTMIVANIIYLKRESIYSLLKKLS